ncbi:MAG: hypothetical protein HYY50_04455 [Candidatus Kerfeldbacteria bacterium]|nr:hypothetical protein [Candidatus Kerfeldbacteria bacterium]
MARSRIFFILGVAILVGLGGLLVQQWWSRRPSTEVNDRPAASTDQTNATNRTTRPTFERFPVVILNDGDGDGLADDEEQRLGTDPDLADSDGDGLSDREETSVYQTNPRLQDSDGDGGTDGQEIARGDNPLGSGSLRNLNEAIQQLSNQ